MVTTELVCYPGSGTCSLRGSVCCILLRDRALFIAWGGSEDFDLDTTNYN